MQNPFTNPQTFQGSLFTTSTVLLLLAIRTTSVYDLEEASSGKFTKEQLMDYLSLRCYVHPVCVPLMVAEIARGKVHLPDSKPGQQYFLLMCSAVTLSVIVTCFWRRFNDHACCQIAQSCWIYEKGLLRWIVYSATREQETRSALSKDMLWTPAPKKNI